jgi:hypothetical protein
MCVANSEGVSRSAMSTSDISLDLSSASSDSSDEEYRLAEKEWQESLAQIHQLISLVLLPWIGKYLGRRWSYWGQYAILLSLLVFSMFCTAYARYTRLGWGMPFFTGERPRTI